MKNSHLRIIFLLSVLSTVVMLFLQYLEIKKSVDLADKSFDSKASYALRSVGENLMRASYPSYMGPADMVQQKSSNYFVVKVGDKISYTSLKQLLIRELKMQGLVTDFEFGAYDCEDEKMKYGERVYVDSNAAKNKVPTEFPKLKDINYYFGVNFPDKNNYISGEVWYLKLSSFFLLALFALLSYIVTVVFKQRRLQEVQKDFVNNMTHEFKTPLSSIQIASEVLKNPKIVNSPERLLTYATLIGNETTHLTNQVERVLHMANTERGTVVLKKEKFVLNEVIDEIYNKYKGFVRSKEGDFVVNAESKQIEIFADKLHFKNVVSNLVDNAIKYCDKNPRIEISFAEKNNGLELSVADNGIGIKPEHIKNIFDKFYRVPSGNVHDVKGFGIGLSYVKLILKEHGGQIKCSSEFGKGTIFTIFIPNS